MHISDLFTEQIRCDMILANSMFTNKVLTPFVGTVTKVKIL